MRCDSRLTIRDLYMLGNSLKARQKAAQRWLYVCHPDSFALVCDAARKASGEPGFFPMTQLVPLPVEQINANEYRIGDMRWQTNAHVPRFAKRWVPPRGRFWECEPSDEAWCAPLGIGHYEDDPSQPWIVRINMDACKYQSPLEFSPMPVSMLSYPFTVMA